MKALTLQYFNSKKILAKSGLSIIPTLCKNAGLDVEDVSHEIEEPKNENTRSIPLSPNQLNSTLHEEGEEVDNHFQ